MNENANSWYHCGHCGSLFQSLVSIRTRRICTACGQDPLATSDGNGQKINLPAPRTTNYDEEAAEKQRARQASQRRKANILTAKIVVSSLLTMSVIVFISSKLWAPPETETPPGDLMASLDPTAAKDMEFLQNHLAACQQVFGQFLVAETPEARAQFVVSSSAMVGRMSRHYSQNPTPGIDPRQLSYQGGGVLHLPDGGQGIEVRWTTPDGLRVDTLFFKDGDEWRLDWEHFVRHSDFPWSLFLAGSGEPTGEFRLLARERLSGQENTALPLSIVFYQPRQGQPTNTGSASPEFIVARDSPQGIQLEKALAAAKAGKPLFSVEKLPVMEPDGFIRVRVKVRREDTEEGRRFHLEEVAACHWLGHTVESLSQQD